MRAISPRGQHAPPYYSCMGARHVRVYFVKPKNRYSYQGVFHG